MSRSLRKPSVTPLTAFATRLRARPWNLPSSGSSRSVFACSWSPLTSKPIPGGSAWRIFPFGPCTSTAPGWTSIVTPFGMGIIFLPIRDINSFQLPASSFQLPHVTEHFAADAGLHRFAAGHDPAGGRQDAGAEAREDVRDIVAAEVDAAARTADALDADDDALPARPVLQLHAERALRLVVLRLHDLEALDLAFALQDFRDLDLQARERHIDAGMARRGRVPDPGEHVCDRVCHILLNPV